MNAPLYGLHRTSADKVLSAASFTHSYQLNDWLKGLDIRGGDYIEFQEVTARPEFDEVPETPAFINTQPPAPTPALAGDDQPF